MTIEERWGEIDDLLKVKHLKVSEGERLRAHVVALLLTPEGRDSILTRLGGKHFPGVRSFLREVVRAFERPAPEVEALSSEDRQRIQLALLEGTYPRRDRAHWDLLWLLHREGYLLASRRIIDSLIEIAGRTKPISTTLVTMPWWDEFPRDRAAVLLETALRSGTDSETAGRIEQALEWVQRSRAGGAGAPSRPEDTAADAFPRPPPRVQEDQVQTPAAPAEDADLSSCLAAMTQCLTGLHLRHVETRRQMERELAAERERHRLEEGALREQLRLAEEVSQDRLHRVMSLEEDLARRGRELAEAHEAVGQLRQQAAQHRNELEAVERRTADYVHQANLEKENALRTFQAELWNRLHLCLVEVLNGETEPANLTPDQAFFLRRLREIKEALHEHHVPPY